MVEHQLPKLRVAGSNPVSRSTSNWIGPEPPRKVVRFGEFLGVFGVVRPRTAWYLFDNSGRKRAERRRASSPRRLGELD